MKSLYSFEHHLYGDTARIRSEPGYTERVSRDEAMRAALEWERAHAPEQADAARFNYAAEDEALTRLARSRR